jgi:ABC-2 type transport system permease protein
MAMRSFSEELHSGTIELLLTFGAPLWQIVMAKFIAIWLVCLIALSGTFPIVAVTFYLGNPDIGPIITGYVGASLLAGIYVSIGIAMSSITQNQVIAFVLSASLCFVLMVSGYDMILNFFEALGFSQGVLDAISSLSLSLLIDETMRGLLTLNHAVYTLSLIVFWLYIASFVNHNMTEAAS